MSGFRKIHPAKIKGGIDQLFQDVFDSGLRGHAYHERVVEVLERERDSPRSARHYKEMDYDVRIEQQKSKIVRSVLRVLERSQRVVSI